MASANPPMKPIFPCVVDSCRYSARARQISAFLVQDLCANTLIATVVPPIAALLPHLAVRLNAYGWQLITRASPGRIYHLSTISNAETSILTIWSAAHAMEDLANFLGNWLNVLRMHPFELSYANEEALKADLERAVRFIRALCASLPALWQTTLAEESVRGTSPRGGSGDDSVAELEGHTIRDREAERQHEAVESLNNTTSPPHWTRVIARDSESTDVGTQEIETSELPAMDTLSESSSLPAEQQQPRDLSYDSDVDVLILEPRPMETIQIASFLAPPTPSSARKSLPVSDVLTPPCPDVTEILRPCACREPRHSQQAIAHNLHPLHGPRYSSRCGISDQEFTEHCLKYGKWLIDCPADANATIQIGHGAGLSFRYFEASFLGFPGVNIIKIVHPLCALELKTLDWDVIRAVAVHLRQYAGKRSVYSQSRPEAVQEAENTDLIMVELEVESRRRERSREQEITNGPDLIDATRSQLPHDRPPTPSAGHHAQATFANAASVHSLTPPNRPRRSDPDTSRSNGISRARTSSRGRPRFRARL